MWRGWLNARIEALGGMWSFMTLTAHPSAHAHGWTLHNLRDAWKPVYDAIRWRYQRFKPIEYVRVFEKHKSGEYHIHVLWRLPQHPPYNDREWLKATAAAHGLGWRVDWQGIDVGGETTAIARYITKYMSKDAQGLMDMPKGLRRIQTSQGIGALKPPPSDEEWFVRSGIYPHDLRLWETVRDVSTGYTIEGDYFDEFNYYPEHVDHSVALDALDDEE